MKNDLLGDRMKQYEAVETSRCAMPLVPVLARLDGRGFHTFCKGLNKPYDSEFHKLMVRTTEYLVAETNSCIGYTQSDEISLVWLEPFFEGRIQKMVSTLAAMATVRFNKLLPYYLPSKQETNPTFDCRVWSVPNKEEAANAFLWREQDASRNSVLAAGQAVFSHNALQRLSTKQVQEKLFKDAGINWNDYPAWAKRGSWVQKRTVVRAFSPTELENLPPKHEAHKNPALLVERNELEVIAIPKFGSVANRVGVIFDREAPEVLNE